jgi:hypothetical protein
VPLIAFEDMAPTMSAAAPDGANVGSRALVAAGIQPA